MQIAILVYDRFTALDAVGPYEVLSRVPGAEVTFVGTEARLCTTDPGPLTVVVERSLDEVPRPDIVLVPGGPGGEDAMRDERVLDWLRTAHETSTWTTSVCTGSLILAWAGVLDGVRATSHWLAMRRLGELGAVPVQERVVEEGKIVTAAGVSAGIDMALTLAGRIVGSEQAQFIQLFIEYDPQPPFDTGSPAKAPEDLVRRARELSRMGG